MPFKQDPNEIIKDAFGMTAEEIKTILTESKAMKASIEEVKTLSTSTSTVLGELKTSIEGLKVSTPYDRRDNNNNGDNKDNKPEPARWDVDADAAFKDRLTEANKPIIGLLLDTRAMNAKREAMDAINADNPDLPWNIMAKEIEEKSKNDSLEYKANPQYWKNVYYVCVGEKRPEIERDKQAKKGRFFTETASSSIVVDTDDNKKPEDKLSPQQLAAAAKSGLSPAEYAKELESITVWR